jgi:hypothetical protein
VVSWLLAVKSSVITDWEVWAFCGVNTGWILGTVWSAKCDSEKGYEGHLLIQHDFIKNSNSGF